MDEYCVMSVVSQINLLPKKKKEREKGLIREVLERAEGEITLLFWLSFKKSLF